MTQEEKQFLLADICTRLPYGVIYHCNYGANIRLKEIDINRGYFNYTDNIEERECKPYLRPMSSMTEEERMEFIKLFDKWHDDELFDYIEEGVEFSIWKHKGISPVIFDWLNAHHFDYRGLISMGLALEAPEDMYDTKTE